ncbi:Uncharacterised protein [Klebsiella pneumoniae]|nr:Uncharacterised protein [Klebsiella pneumoniae]
MMSLWDALRMNMMISYQELVRTFPFKDEIKQSQVLYFQFHASLLFLQSITGCQFRRY